MKKDETDPKKFAALRRRAEKQIGEQIEDTNKLSVHKIELEMQNEELKAAQEELIEARDKYSDLYDFAPVGYFTFDKNGIVVGANITGSKLLGVGRRNLIGKPFSLYVAPDDRDIFRLHLKQVMETKAKQVCEIQVLKTKETIFHAVLESILIEGNNREFYQCRTTMTDITARNQAEEELRRERDRAQQYLDLAGVIMVAIGGDHKINLINIKGCEVLESTKEEIIGKDWFDNFVPERNRNEVKGIYEKLIKGFIQPVEYAENNIITKSGKERIIAWHNTVLKDENGKIVGTLSSGQDISDKRKMETQLLHSEKLAAVGTLAYGIAHEFNNILAGMMVNAELGATLDDPSKIKECFEAIMDNCQRGSSITYSLLAVAGEKKGKKELNDITQALQGVLSFIRRELEKANIKTIESFKPVPRIFCDPAEFTEVFLNMLTNARDAMHPQGGTLTIKLEQIEDNIRIVFKDTGCGIPDEIRTKIFDPFVTTKGALGKNDVAGTGLGLFLSYGIIDRYQGKIEMDTKPGKGTAFTIFIPISKNLPSESYVEKEIKPAAEIQRKLNILLIDDEEVICSILKKFLEAKGHQVTASLKATEGLGYFKKNKFDVVLSDITMPEMDGIEFIRQIKEQDRSAKVIVITGHVQKAKEDAAKDAGADEILIKPFRNEQLYQTINKVLAS